MTTALNRALKTKKLFVFDMDGTVFLGGRVFDFAAELAKKADVSLRSVQMYEQRNKDINKASVETVYRLAKSLGCTVEDLIEK